MSYDEICNVMCELGISTAGLEGRLPAARTRLLQHAYSLAE